EGDDAAEIRLEKLRRYRMRLEAPSELASLIRRHGLPVELFEDLLDAFTQDVKKNRYAKFSELLDYCRRSANPVGRLLLHLFKRTSDSDLACSDAICSALQLINFWQDVEIDYARGRIYLPQDEMARHHVTEQHLLEKRCDDSWRAPKRRRAITALYAFCREVDDVVDETSDPQVAGAKLAWWRAEIANLAAGKAQHPVSLALAPFVEKFGITAARLNEIIDGMEMDLTQTRYLDWRALEHYCYHVAGVVGLLAAGIFGYRDARTLDYAKDLGIAFQLTNIIRDVGEDA